MSDASEIDASKRDASKRDDGRAIPMVWALAPIAALAFLLYCVLVVMRREHPDVSLDVHLPLILAACVAGLIARAFGWKWAALENGILIAVALAMPAILILLTIGMVIGIWISTGIVPAMISWGLSLLSPTFFLPASCLVCSIVSLVTGSSWSTAGTIGIALIGVGGTLGIPEGLSAGAILSGAYFGDKLSPMSETTNLAPAMAGTDLISHIRHMLFTTVPAWTLSMLLYIAYGMGFEAQASPADIQAMQATIEGAFHPSLLHLLPPALVLGLVLKKLPAVPSLLAGCVVAAAIGLLNGLSVAELLAAAYSGFKSDTGSATLNTLLQRGGMSSLMSVVLLIFSAMCFGGIMERTGMLHRLAEFVLKRAKSSGSLIASTVLTSVAINILAADQYISIVVPGRMFAKAYAQRGLHPKNLSRALEDGGTITSALVPWNSCGAYMSSTLGVATLTYLPYAFLNIINPLLGILFAYLGWTVAPLETAGDKNEAAAAS
jgi:NhaC family Na+:H+ antiporter